MVRKEQNHKNQRCQGKEHRENRENRETKATAEKLYRKFVDATVTINAIGATPLEPGRGGSGFFISSDGIIVTNAHVIFNKEQNTLFAKYGVLVTNFNGTGKNYQLDADVLGFDKAGDLAVLKINKKYKMKCQNYLNWGKSLETCIGSAVYNISSPSPSEASTDVQSVFSGVLQDNMFCPMYTKNDGEPFEVAPTLECLRVSFLVQPGSSGSPFLDKNGKIIGVNSFINQISSFGPSQRMAEPIVSWIVENRQNYPLNYALKRGQIGLRANPFTKSSFIASRLLGLDDKKAFEWRGFEIPLNAWPENKQPVATIPLQFDDIITRVDKYVVGELNGQTNISTAYWTKKQPGDKIKIKFIRLPPLIPPRPITPEDLREITTIVTLQAVDPDADVVTSGIF